MDVKKAFIEAYQKTFGNKSQSCKAVGISRRTLYNWMQDDEEFKTELSTIEPEEDFLDHLEHKLGKLIDEENPAAIIFALKTKGKKRGYIERQEFTGAEGVPIMPTIILQNVPALEQQYGFKPETNDSLPPVDRGQ